MDYEAKLEQLLDIVRPAEPAWADELEQMPDGPLIRFMVDQDSAVIENSLGGFWLHIKRYQLPDGTFGFSWWRTHQAPQASAEDWTRLRTEPIPRFQVQV